MSKRTLRNLKLKAIAAVDLPCQEGAQMSIIKRAPDGTTPVAKHTPSILAVSVAKYVSDEDGAHTFAQVLQANEFDEKIWPMTSALSQSIRSIMGDKDIKGPEKETKVTQSVDEFLAAVRDLSPTAADTMAKAISKGKSTMDWEAIAKKAQADLETANAALAKAKTDLTAAEQKVKDATDEKDKMSKALVEATDEAFKSVDGTEVRKSAVGDGNFAMFKSLDNRARTAELEKRASEEYPNVTGTATAKALILKAREVMDEDTQKALDAVLASNQQMAAGAFKSLGNRGGTDPASVDVEKAVSTFKGKVSEIEKRDGISNMDAMRKARSEFPEEFKAAYPDQAAA